MGNTTFSSLGYLIFEYHQPRICVSGILDQGIFGQGILNQGIFNQGIELYANPLIAGIRK